jgi:DNA-binding NtrC family response regulator
VITLEVPPLRERPEEILPLARNFVAEAGPDPKQITPATEERLLAWTWPGNIRELRNALLRAAILAPGDRILPEHLPPQVLKAPISPETGPRSLADIERNAIFEALKRCDGNRTRAARELGISRRKLLYRLRDYGQDSP